MKVDRRPKRVPIGTRDKLTAEGKPGFYRRFVNDTEDRIQQFVEAGYTLVAGGSSPGQKNVGDALGLGSSVSKKVGNGVTAYLMELPEKFHKEDMAAKERRNKKLDSSVLTGEDGKSLTNNKFIYGDGVDIKRPTITDE